MLVFFGQLLENFERVIGGTIVDEDKFVIVIDFFNCWQKGTSDEIVYVGFLVINWNNN